MLKLSSRGDYGLMLLRHLAGLKKGQFANLGAIARQRRLPLRYLEQLARDLSGAGVLISKEGRGGGYALAKPPAGLKLARILAVLEGGLEPARCEVSCQSCARQTACEQKTGWHSLHRQLYDALSKYTLADVIQSK